MAPSRVFLSFSGDDATVVRAIYASLSSQGLLVWDYSNPGEMIHVSASIPEQLRKRIESADCFVVCVSASSLDTRRGRYVQLELAHALHCGFIERGRMFILALGDSADLRWTAPFDALRDRRHVHVRPDDPRSVD